MVEVDPVYGTVLNSVTYDTYVSFTEADNMAVFINSIASGNIVLSAVKDEASSQMTGNAIAALGTLVSGDPLSWRSSWAFIAIKGSPLSAIQNSASQYGGPVSVTTTINPVPVPSAVLLFAPGLVGLAAMRRRFKK